MWRNSSDNEAWIEEKISAASTLPHSSSVFRARVMEHALQAQRNSVNLHGNQQSLAVVLLTVALVGLPSYYYSLRLASQPRTTVWKETQEDPVWSPTLHDARRHSGDSYEWGMVDAAFSAHPLAALRSQQWTL